LKSKEVFIQGLFLVLLAIPSLGKAQKGRRLDIKSFDTTFHRHGLDSFYIIKVIVTNNQKYPIVIPNNYNILMQTILPLLIHLNWDLGG